LAHTAQYIFSDENFSKPYFLTYLSASCFSLYLGGFLFKPRWRTDMRLLLQERFGPRATTFAISSPPESDPLLLNNDDHGEHPASSINSLPLPPQPGAPGEGEEALQQHGTETKDILTMRETIVVALKFVALWFSANYIYKYAKRVRTRWECMWVDGRASGLVGGRVGGECLCSGHRRASFVRNIPTYLSALRPLSHTYSVSLVYTSVASNTILSATSSFFTLVFGALFPGTADDHFSLSKLVCVLLSIGGVVLVR
jgi:hypothetical protein